MLKKKSLRLSVTPANTNKIGIGDDADIPDTLTEGGHAGHGHEHTKQKDERVCGAAVLAAQASEGRSAERSRRT